jgi:hemerythrin superfamily protein
VPCFICASSGQKQTANPCEVNVQTASKTKAATKTGEFPARGSDAVEILINDHDVIKGLLSKLVDATTAAARKNTLEQLKGILTIHNATEENLVYPALSIVAHRRMQAQHLYHETADADLVVFKLDMMLKKADDEKFDDLAAEFRDSVLEHIGHEEKSAFPQLKKKAASQQMQTLTKDVREFRGKLHMDDKKR